jgi:hypothetical protein
MRKRSKETSQKQLAANRSNAQKSTGPRRPRVSRRALLRQSRYVKTLSYDQAKLGESSEDFQEYLADLVADWQPVGAMEMTLVEDLATLEMERRLVDRAQRGRLVQRLEREEAKVDRNARRLLDDSTDCATREAVVEQGLRNSPDCPAKFRQMMDLIEPLLATVRCGDFSSPAEEIFIALYGEHPSWRAAQIISLYRKFVERYAEAPEDFPADEDPDSSQDAEPTESAYSEGKGAATTQVDCATPPIEDLTFDKSAPSERERFMDALSLPFESCDGRTPWGEAEREPGRQRSMDEGEFRTLQRLLLEEYDAVVSAYGDFMRDRTAFTRARRDALLAPTGYRSALLIRQKNSIDRHLERKIKLLILLQKERRNRGECPHCHGNRNVRGTGSGAKAPIASIRDCAPAGQNAVARIRASRKRPASRFALHNSAAWLGMLWLAQFCVGAIANTKRFAALAAALGVFVLLGAGPARPRPAEIAIHQSLGGGPSAGQSHTQAPNRASLRDVFLRTESRYVEEKKEKGMETKPNWEALVRRPLKRIGPLSDRVIERMEGRNCFSANHSIAQSPYHSIRSLKGDGPIVV